MSLSGDGLLEETGLRELLAGMSWPWPLRRHQDEALRALAQACATGRRRAWLVLPPGAGKTLAGLEAARRLGRRIVVFSPNTAIQGQWVTHWRAYRPAAVTAGTERDLSHPVTSLTYQSLATFDPEAEVDEEGRARAGSSAGSSAGTGAGTGAGEQRRAGMLDRLHSNGQALVAALREAGPITLVLDECHHLLEVWGQLLAELLDALPDAYVLGLTATPPQVLSAEQAELSGRLFGDPVYAASVPAVVREGHLAPFAELAFLTTPTSSEADWLAAETERFAELRTQLLDPAFARLPFLDWLQARFVERAATPAGGRTASLPVSWARLEKDRPELAAASLRLHHVGLLTELPPGARLREEHRHTPTAEDWVELLGDYVKAALLGSDDPRDAEALAAIRRSLPAIGYTLTRNGIRVTRTPVDRVLARSEAKTHAAVEIAAAEADNLGPRLRALILCDHEQAAATLQVRLRGVLDEQAGSARLMLANLVADPRTAVLRPVLVTGRTVAADGATARAFIAYCATEFPRLRLDPVPADAAGVIEITAVGWSSRTWVPAVTRFFESGGTQVLVGTRALLGEGWDARGVNTLVDLTTVTTATSVVQTRGRTLRTDPVWPGKVAHNWTVVCVSDTHPKGAADWNRFVRKHTGYLAVTETGEIADGVAHVDPAFSPYAPPPVADFPRINAAMLVRASDRDTVRALWRIGTPYRDTLVHTVRIAPSRARPPFPVAIPGTAPVTALTTALTTALGPPPVVPAARGAWRAGDCPDPARLGAVPIVSGGLAGLGLFAAHTPWPFAAGAAGVVAAPVHAAVAAWKAGTLLAGLAGDTDLLPFAYAVADALQLAGMSRRGADAVAVTADRNGTYTVALSGVPTQVSELFADCLDEVLSPMAAPRYVVPRYLFVPLSGIAGRLRAGRSWLRGRAAPNQVVYHAVPASFGARKEQVARFTKAWNRWVSAGDPVYCSSPEGEGILVTHRGQDPCQATTALRVAWD